MSIRRLRWDAGHGCAADVLDRRRESSEHVLQLLCLGIELIPPSAVVTDDLDGPIRSVPRQSFVSGHADDDGARHCVWTSTPQYATDRRFWCALDSHLYEYCAGDHRIAGISYQFLGDVVTTSGPL